MHQPSTIAFIGMLALTMYGCGSRSEESSTAVSPAPQVVEKQSAAKAFEKPPIVAQKPEKSLISSAPGLIQPTNPNERSKQVSKGRSDPFAGLFLQTVPNVPSTVAPPQRIVTRLPSPPVAPKPQTVAVQSKPPRPVVNRGNSARQLPPVVPSPVPTNPLPTVVPGYTSQPVVPPPPPEPDLARGVTVTGVVQVGNETNAIVQVPNEATSRYVQVGQRLSNGQVLVKRIEMNEGSAPVVILEQNGVDVARAVGEEAVKPAQPGTSTNASPVPPSLPSNRGSRED